MSESGSLPPKMPWADRWRTGIRATETTIVISLWAAGVSASDMLIATVLLLAGLVVGTVAIAIDPVRSRITRLVFIGALAAWMACSEGIVYSRYQMPTPAPPLVPKASHAQPPSLLDAFLHQQGNYGMLGTVIPVIVQGARVNVPVNVYADAVANSKFAAILVPPERADQAAILISIAKNPQDLKGLIQSQEAKVWDRGEIPDDKQRHMVFTGEVYVYSSGLSVDDMKSIEVAFGKIGMKFRPRDYSYLFRHYQGYSPNPINPPDASPPSPVPPK